VAYKKPHEMAQYNIQYQFSVNVCCGERGNKHLLDEVQQPCITGMFWKRSAAVFREFASCNSMNVATTCLSTSAFLQKGYRIYKYAL
jgi:hypothetical protein